MNTLKFTKANLLATEMSNLELQESSKEIIFGKEINIYHPCNLNIFITSDCQNKCYFCINEQNNSKVPIYHQSNLEYIQSLEFLLKELKNKHFEITITGGEPTLNMERFVKTMQMCYFYNFPCRTVSTTGLNLMKEFQNKPLVQYMIENKFIHNINISRMHYNQEKNDEIFKNKNISNQDIEKLGMFFELNNADMRLSCNLIKNYIDDFDKILYLVDFYDDLGVESIIFRELVGVESVKLKDINFDKRFKYITTLHGALYDVDVYMYKDFIVKHYMTKEKVEKNIIYSFSFKNGYLLDNFSGGKINLNLNRKGE